MADKAPYKSKKNAQDGKVRNFGPGPEENIGKVPPQSLEMESAVLGALLLEKDALHKVIDVLKPEMFYKTANQEIYEAIQTLFQRSEPVDILSVKEFLRKAGKLDMVGGAYYLAQLTSNVASSANIEFHARIVSEKYLLRRLITMCGETLEKAYDPTSDALELLDSAEQQIFEVSESQLKRNYASMDTLVMETLERLEEIRGQDSSITGIPSGFADLDAMTAGWQRTDMVIIAARPAMGKTALALTLARNAAVRFDTPVALFSLEMAGVQLTQRLITSEAELDAQKVRTGRLEDYEWKQLITRIGGLSKAAIYIDDTPGLALTDLRAKARRLKAERNIGIIMIDYLQLMTGSTANGGNREQEIAGISRSLKIIAKELDVCVIALAQLSRAVESRGGDKRPVLSDLRESGSIEQDADMVAFLYRPEYYGFETDEEGNSTQGLAELIIAKQRNGPTGTVKLQFIGKYGKFSDWGYNAPTEAQPGFGQGGDVSGQAGNTITFQSKINQQEGKGDNLDVPF